MELDEFDIEFLSLKMSENPQSPLFARLADLYLRKEQSDEAIKLLEEGIKLFPDYYAGYLVLGKVHLAFKEFSKAHSAFEKALDLSPFNQTAAKLLQSVPNRSDESTRTTDENYFTPAPSPAKDSAVEPTQDTPQQVQFESPNADEIGFSQHSQESSGSTYDQSAAQSYGTQQTSGSFPTYDDYFAQNQSRISSDSPMKLDDYLNDSQIEQSTDIDSLAEKLQHAEKIIPQENYQPKNPAPQEPQNEQAYETDAVTPTLAEIYASQGELRAAIQAYEILMFSQPAKAGEFQQRIRELQQLQMEKDGLI